MPQDMGPDATETPVTAETRPANDTSAPHQAAGSASVPEQAAEPAMPPLTPQEFRIYNRLAEQMDYFVCTYIHTPTYFLFPTDQFSVSPPLLFYSCSETIHRSITHSPCLPA